MQFLKRKVKSEKEESQEVMTASMVDGIRLCLRFADKKKPSTDVVISFTSEETEKIRGVMK